MDQLTRIDKALDEALVNLGAIVLRLSDPAVTRTAHGRRALVRSVNQFSLCADRSGAPACSDLRVELEETIRPKLRLVSGQAFRRPRIATSPSSSARSPANAVRARGCP